jgi:hypothetical protein
MTEEPPKKTFADLIANLGRYTASSHALVSSAFLEGQLRDAILTRFRPNLSNRMREKLSTGYGPLASFSAKIDFAFAMGLIEEIPKQDFHAIREIRNAFAHPDSLMHYANPIITELSRKFHGSRGTMTNQELYDHKIAACAESLSSVFKMHYLVTALMNYRAENETPSPSPEKSE